MPEPVKRSVPINFALLALSAALMAHAESASTVPASTVPASSTPAHSAYSVFRNDYPAPENLDEAAAFYALANRKLVGIAEKGAAADIELLFPDGSRETGRDIYFSSFPRVLVEKRRSYEAILVGERGCMKKINERWKCGSYTFYLGLREIDPTAIFEIIDEIVPCGDGKCRRLTLLQATNIGIAEKATSSPYPGVTVPLHYYPKTNHYRLVLTAKADGQPVSFSETLLEDGVTHSPAATFRFDFETEVKRPGLPDMDQPSSGQEMPPADAPVRGIGTTATAFQTLSASTVAATS
jgi:hypothetical protein